LRARSLAGVGSGEVVDDGAFAARVRPPSHRARMGWPAGDLADRIHRRPAHDAPSPHGSGRRPGHRHPDPCLRHVGGGRLMSGESLYEWLTAEIVDAVRDALNHVDEYVPPLTPPDEAGARAALTDLTNRAQAITNAADPAAWLGAVEQWKSALNDLADKAFGGPTPLDSLAVRVLVERMPRTAAFLTLVGVIVSTPGGQDQIDRAKAQRFFTDPGSLVNEALWDALLGDASIPGTGRLPAVIVGALLLAPQTIIGLAHGSLKVAGLSPPPTDAPGPWRTFRESSNDWLSFTVPLGDPVSATPVPRGIYDWRADLLPDLSATLAMRSRRVPLGGGNSRTEFEMWLAIALEQNEWRYHFTDGKGNDTGWYLRVAPRISGGFGYDGE